MSLIRLLLDSLADHADALAVIDGDRRFSYADLDQLSTAMAGGLYHRGTGSGDLVCLRSTRSWERCAAVLATWRVGAGVMSVDPALPMPRVERILRTTQPTVVVRDRSVAPLAVGVAETTYTDLQSASVARCVDGPVGYVITTSGSTGEPKSMALPPGVLAELGVWHRDRWRHGVTAHTLHAASIGFDVGYEELVTTLVAGAALVVVDDHQRRDGFELIDLMRAHEVARVFQSVGGLHALAMAGAVGDRVSSLREIVVAGEQLVVNDEVRAFCSDNRIDLVNEYGPSETHVVTQHRLSGDPRAWPSLPPIGVAAMGAELLRLDGDEIRSFDPGDEGELVIAGNCVGLGYLGDELLTARKFRQFGNRRCYITGDVVRFDDGVFTFVSRVDDQLKVSGYRVEPGDVEGVLGRVAGVRRVAVVGVSRNESTRLAACYVRDAADLTEADLREACVRELPEYMVPTLFLELDALPLNANGKINRAVLRTML